MGRSSIERRARRAAAAALAISLSIAAGAGIAGWAVSDANGFYMNPIDRYGTPGYARQRPVADTFWQRQGSDVATARAQDGAISTATSAQPAYRSASGS